MTEPLVSLAQGKLLGKVSENLNGENFYSFHGIPYAKPPIENLRFKAPQPPESWSGVRDATKEGSECCSRHMIFLNVLGSEDCLTLNVYTPHLPGSANTGPKPVMVWIHGGAFKSGSSKRDVYGPEYLLTEDIVLVTINYRLGIFGFLHLEDPSLDIPGNAGLKDMVMALKWVQKNISSFSGDPNNVTIFGESAGGASVHYLVLSPAAKGLFHKAIAQSGCALNSFATGRDDITSHLASILEMKSATEHEILQRLMSLSGEELFELSEKVITSCEALNNSGGKLVFAPVVERPSAEAFLSEQPIKILKSGNYNQVPIIFGYTTTEGMLIELKIRPRQPSAPKDFETIIPHALQVVRGSENSKNIAKKIKEFYYGQPDSENVLDNFYKIHTDNYFFRDIMFATQHHSVYNKYPVFLYRMSADTSLNIFKKIGKISAPGVCHGDDIGYLFKTKVSPPLNPGSVEELSVKRFVTYWTNFAKYGNPNSKELSGNPEWKPVKPSEINFVDIGEKLTANVNPEFDRMEFWKNIYSNHPYSL
ncbi:juvenile hormone esterase-like [Zophobas morio]